MRVVVLTIAGFCVLVDGSAQSPPLSQQRHKTHEFPLETASAEPANQYLLYLESQSWAESAIQQGNREAANSQFRSAIAMLEDLQVRFPNWRKELVQNRLDTIKKRYADYNGEYAPDPLPTPTVEFRPAQASPDTRTNGFAANELIRPKQSLVDQISRLNRLLTITTSNLDIAISANNHHTNQILTLLEDLRVVTEQRDTYAQRIQVLEQQLASNQVALANFAFQIERQNSKLDDIHNIVKFRIGSRILIRDSETDTSLVFRDASPLFVSKSTNVVVIESHLPLPATNVSSAFQSSPDQSVPTQAKSTNENTQLKMAASAFAHQEYQKAQVLYSTILRQNATNQSALYGLAAVHYCLRHDESCKATLSQLLELNPNHLQARQLSAQLTPVKTAELNK